MNLTEKIEHLSKAMHKLTSGHIAGLRRMNVDGPGTTAFWSLANTSGFIDDEITPWMQLVKIMAILTPAGDSDYRSPLHDKNRRFGSVLCDGGNPEWPGSNSDAVRPFISETRLARLIAQRHDQRCGTLERMARMISKNRSPRSGIDCVALAMLILNIHSQCHLRDLTMDYYKRLDRAEAGTK